MTDIGLANSVNWRVRAISTRPEGSKKTQHNSIDPGALGDFSVAPHDVELILRIAEIATSRSNDDMQRKGYTGSDGLQKAEAGSNAPLEQVAAEFNPLRPAALRCCGGGDRVHADFNQHRFHHDVGRVVGSCILLTSIIVTGIHRVR